MFANNNIPSKYLRSFDLPGDTHVILLEINLKQRKLLVVSIYRPLNENLDYFLSSIIGLLDRYIKSQEGSCIDLIIASRHTLHQFLMFLKQE